MAALSASGGRCTGKLSIHALRQKQCQGNNLILEQIREGNETIPLRMAPLVLFGTLITHLFGGSAGREGTAVQMGAAWPKDSGDLLRSMPWTGKYC